MTTTKKQFELFKKECRKWADRFGLNGWRFDFHLLDIGENQAEVRRDFMDCVATVRLHIELEKVDGETWTDVIKNSAKHEMIHVLLGNIATLANSRHVQADEIVKADEELTRKLEEIIK